MTTATLPIDITHSVTCINGGLGPDTTRTHTGGCHVGLYMTFAGLDLRGDQLLREVIGLWEGTEQFDNEIALVTPLFDRIVLNGLHVPVTAEEGEALRVLCSEAETYWDVNDYANDENEEDRLLGLSHPTGIAVCWNQTDLALRKLVPVGLREKPYRWATRRYKDYS